MPVCLYVIRRLGEIADFRKYSLHIQTNCSRDFIPYRRSEGSRSFAYSDHTIALQNTPHELFPLEGIMQHVTVLFVEKIVLKSRQQRFVRQLNVTFEEVRLVYGAKSDDSRIE